MTHSHPYPYPDLQGAATRNTTAADLLTAFAKSAPALNAMWQHVFAALDDTPALITEIDRLRTALAATRYQRANLIAAIRATLSAHRDGERDPLYYIRDELNVQTHTRGRGR
ncbi:hypothetical protein [Nonomuraea africana]|uniref:hypothetical protein n=1 Tax=Nonomuraea africana TaxID=46171 RepID=UPI0033E2E8F9